MHCNIRDDFLQFSFTVHFENFNIFGGLYITQLSIYDGAFIVKIVSRFVHSQKSSIVDVLLGSKYASAFWRHFKCYDVKCFSS